MTPFQRRVAEIVAALDEAQGFALGGGAALIMRGDVQRRTRDLDFFGLEPEDVQRLLPATERALRDQGFDVQRVREGPAFVRLQVQWQGEATELDLATDARLFAPESEQGVPTLTSPRRGQVASCLRSSGSA